MKKAFKLLGLLAFAAVIVFSMTAATCGSKSGGSSDGGSSKTAESGSGKGGQTTFTLTDIPPEYNGKYARITAVGGKLTLTGAQNISNTTVTLPRISNGKVVIPMWIIRSTTSFERYTGNDSFSLGTVNFRNSGNDNVNSAESNIADIIFMSIAFSNGNATKSWNEALTVMKH